MTEFFANPDLFGQMLIRVLTELNPDKDPKYIKSFVKYVIETDASFISKQTVLDNYGYCKRCGQCCRDCNCEEFDGQLCRIWDSMYKSNNEWKPRRGDICRIYPFWEVPGEAHGIHFVPQCAYAFKVVLSECMRILGGAKMIVQNDYFQNLLEEIVEFVIGDNSAVEIRILQIRRQ